MNKPASDKEPDNEGPGNEGRLERPGTGFFSVLKSVLAAGFGVQSGENRERDFTQGKASHFIIGGILGTLIFVVCIIVLVKVLLANV